MKQGSALMEGISTVVVVLVFQIVIASRQSSQHYLQSSTCVNSSTDVTCPAHRKIAIRRIVYGAKRTSCTSKDGSCCTQKRDDCFIHHDAAILSMNTYCSGHRHCSASTRVTSGWKSDQCEFPPSYGTILYDCIHVKDIAEFGTNCRNTNENLYLSNIDYPSQLSNGNTTHRCRVTSHNRTNLIIRSIDMLLTGHGYRPRVCDQRLTIEGNDSRPVTYTCRDRRYYGFTQVYQGFGDSWEITLRVNTSRARGRIWLAISASEKVPLTIECLSTGHFLVTTDITTVTSHDDQEDLIEPSSFDTGILWGSIAGAVLLTVAMFVLLFWKCKQRKTQQKASPQENGSVARPINSHLSHFPDVCRTHEYTAMPITKGNNSGDNTPMGDNSINDNYELMTSQSRPTSIKLKKKVSFRDILAEDNQSNGSSSRPTSYSGSSFYTFGKVDDDIDGLDIQNRDLPPPPDWIQSNVTGNPRHSYVPDRQSFRISTASRDLDQFYNDVMSGEVFADMSHLSLYEDVNDASQCCHDDGDFMVIENELYESRDAMKR